jgi:hypothetical protein
MNATQWSKARHAMNNYQGHPKGYCNNQMCCWGPARAKVLWPNKREAP